MQKFLLLLHGPSCGGKSSVSRLFVERTPQLCHLGFDKIKWCFSDYLSGKYRETLSNMLFAMSEEVLKSDEGLSVIFDGGLRHEETGGHDYKELAKKYNIRFIEVNIEAPLDVLEARFAERVQRAQEKGSRISMTSMDTMKEKYEYYLSVKKIQIPTFDSSTMSPEGIYEGIVELIEQ